VCACRPVRTVGGGVVRVDLRRGVRGVQEPLVAQVAFAAAEEDVGALLPLHTLVTAEDTEADLVSLSAQRTQRQFILFKCE